jgi:pimeloyl-ACP methyl ester carboxylesterase
MRSRWTDVDGPVHYADYGGAGRSMVLLHGLGGSYVEWHLVGERLAGEFSVVAPDFAGFGRTPLKLRHAGLDDNQRLLDGFLREVVREPAILVAHSMGGTIAMLQAGRHPETVSELVLLDPAAPPGAREVTPVIPKRLLRLVEDSPALGNIAGIILARVIGPTRLVADTVRRAVVDYEAIDRGLIDALAANEVERLRAGRPYVGYIEARLSLAYYYSDIEKFDTEVVDAVKAPTLLVYGEEDPIVPPVAMRRLARRQPGWKVVSLPNVGHDPNFEAPDRLVDLVLDHLGVPAAG